MKSKTVIKTKHNFQHNPNFFNDIFNVRNKTLINISECISIIYLYIFQIPIATLGAVNQFLNNKVANSDGNIQITKTKTKTVAIEKA